MEKILDDDSSRSEEKPGRERDPNEPLRFGIVAVSPEKGAGDSKLE
jgi:hypothetical protein